MCGISWISHITLAMATGALFMINRSLLRQLRGIRGIVQATAISIRDNTSGALVWWHPRKGCCDVIPIMIKEKDVEAELARAQAFYGPSGTASIIRAQGGTRG